MFKIKLMSVINYLGSVLDSSKEHELFSENLKFGFDISVEYTSDSWMSKAGHSTSKFNNCTEFHWRYTDIFNVEPSDGVAFESDIHCTGCTRKIENIKSVTIVEADKLHNKY